MLARGDARCLCRGRASDGRSHRDELGDGARSPRDVFAHPTESTTIHGYVM